MDKEQIIAIANAYAQAVSTQYDFVKIILFGSCVKETNHPDSDIDIAVVLKEFKNITDIRLELMRLRRRIDSRIEPHPFREKDFDPSNPMVYEILKYGKPLLSA